MQLRKELNESIPIFLRFFGLIEVFVLFTLQFYFAAINMSEIDYRDYEDFIFVLPLIITFIIFGILAKKQSFRVIFHKFEFIFHMLISLVSILLIIFTQFDTIPFSHIPYTWRFFLWLTYWGLLIIAFGISELDKPMLNTHYDKKKKAIIFSIVFILTVTMMGLIAPQIENPVVLWVISSVFHSFKVMTTIEQKNTDPDSLLNQKYSRFFQTIKKDLISEDSELLEQENISNFQKRKIRKTRIIKKRSFFHPLQHYCEIHIVFLIFVMVYAWMGKGLYHIELGVLYANPEFFFDIFQNPLFYLGILIALICEATELRFIGESLCFGISLLITQGNYAYCDFIIGFVIISELFMLTASTATTRTLLNLLFATVFLLGIFAMIGAADLYEFSVDILYVIVERVVFYGYFVRLFVELIWQVYRLKDIISTRKAEKSYLTKSDINKEELENPEKATIDDNMKKERNQHSSSNQNQKNAHNFKITKIWKQIPNYQKKTAIVLFIIIAGLFSPIVAGFISTKGQIYTNNQEERIEVTDFIGMCSGAGDPGTYETLSTLGVNKVRLDFSWRIIEIAPGAWNWGQFDYITSLANAYNFDIIAELLYGNEAVTGNDRYKYVAPEDIPLFLEYVNNTVRRYAHSVFAFEIWNEPNHPQFWDGTKAEFINLFNQTKRMLVEIRDELNADYKIVGPSTALSWPGYFEDFFKEGLMDEVDALSVHPYNAMFEESILSVYKQNYQLALEYGYEDMEVWLTEIGSMTDTMCFSNQPHEYMAERTIKTLAISSTMGVTALTWYKTMDSHYPDEVSSGLSQYGVMFKNGTWKTSAHAMSLFSEYCTNTTLCQDLIAQTSSATSLDLTSLLYRKEDGSSALLLWYEPTLTNHEEVTITLNLNAIPGTIKLHNIETSENATIESTSGLKVGSQPVLITFDVDNYETSIEIEVRSYWLNPVLYVLLFGTSVIAIEMVASRLRRLSRDKEI